MKKKTNLVNYKVFSWKGYSRENEPVKGICISEDDESARTQLSLQNIKISKFSKASFLNSKRVQQKVAEEEVMLFARQIATMINSGLTLVKAIESVAVGFENLTMRAVLMTVHKDISSGQRFSQALKKHPKVFSTLFCSLVNMGEDSGALDVVLKQIASYLEKAASLKNKVKKAMFYPAIVLSVSLIISTLLLVFIVPQFENLFKSFDTELPLPTQMIIHLSEFIQNYWLYSIIFIALCFLGFRWHKSRSEKFRLFLDKIILKIYIFGPLLQKAILARVARSLAIMVSSGIPIVTAISSSSDVADNRVYRNALSAVQTEVLAGRHIEPSLSSTKLFPIMMLQMIAVGEESGNLDGMLYKISDYYDEQVDDAVSGLSKLIEPILLVMLGVIIGGFVISMYLPIFKLGELM